MTVMCFRGVMRLLPLELRPGDREVLVVRPVPPTHQRRGVVSGRKDRYPGQVPGSTPLFGRRQVRKNDESSSMSATAPRSGSPG